MTATATKPNPSLKAHFTNLTPGKLSGLRQITDEKGRFRVFALDQSNSFKKALRALAEKLGKPAERAKFLATTGVERMNILNKHVDAYAQPWLARYAITEADLAAAVSPTWYLGKGEAAGKGGSVSGAY